MRVAYPNELYHHGVLGQKWGVRNYQNYDGTLTNKGKERYNEYSKSYDQYKREEGQNRKFHEPIMSKKNLNTSPKSSKSGKDFRYKKASTSKSFKEQGDGFNKKSEKEFRYSGKSFSSDGEGLVKSEINTYLNVPVASIEVDEKEEEELKDKIKRLLNSISWNSFDPESGNGDYIVSGKKESSGGKTFKHNSEDVEELYHYGILGMHWGIRRFQNPDGSLTEAGKKRYGSVDNLNAGRTKKQADKYEEEKSKAIKSGNAKAVSKYSKDLTQEEMSVALQRIRDEQTLSQLRLNEKTEWLNKAKTGIDTARQVKEALSVSKDIYNLAAQTHNALSPNGKKMPVIGEGKPKIAEQKLAYEFEKTKASDKRSSEFENLLRTKDFDYFKNNASKFSTDELKAVQNRFNQTDSMFKVADTPIDSINWPSSGKKDISSSWKETKVSDIDITGTAASQAWLQQFWGDGK